VREVDSKTIAILRTTTKHGPDLQACLTFLIYALLGRLGAWRLVAGPLVPFRGSLAAYGLTLGGFAVTISGRCWVSRLGHFFCVG